MAYILKCDQVVLKLRKCCNYGLFNDAVSQNMRRRMVNDQWKN